MGEINVKGLGRVKIKGDTPTPQEENAILEALGIRPVAQETPIGTVRRPPSPIPARLPPQDQPVGAPAPEIQRVTGGLVNRPAAVALGATAGGVLGTPAGPPGMVGGASLGAGAGSLGFDVAEGITRRVTGRPVIEEGPLQPTRRALGEMAEEAMFTGGAMTLGPVFRALRQVPGAVIGARTTATRGVRAAGERLRGGVPLSPLEATESGFVKGSVKVLGVFPFINTPFRKGAKASAERLQRAADDILDAFGPNATIQSAGVDLSKAAQSEFKEFRRIAGDLYDRFEMIADNVRAFGSTDDVPVKDIFPTEFVRKHAEQLIGRAEEGRIFLRNQQELRSGLTDPVGDFINQMTQLPERLTIKQFRAMTRQLQELVNRGKAEGFDISRLESFKQSMETDLNSPILELLPEDQAVAVVNALADANQFYASSIKRFETATARRFGRFDKNLFGPGPFQAGSLEADELFGPVFRSKSPQALQNLRELVGPDTYNKAVRAFMQERFPKALVTRNNITQYDPDRFAKMLGLDSESGREALSEMLRDTGVSLQTLDDFVDVSRKLVSVPINEPSTFVTRRVTLGGLQSLLGGAAMGALGISNPPAAVALILLARKTGSIITNPDNLKAWKSALDDSLPEQQRRALILRVARSVLGEDTPRLDATRIQPAIDFSSQSLPEMIQQSPLVQP